MLIPVLASAAEGARRRNAPGQGRALVPLASRTDDMLARRAARIQAKMAAHISPEGLLVYRHTRGASPSRLSHEALGGADTAIWSGCYAAAQACRYHVTRDPAALAELRRLAHGLALLSRVTGRPGRLVRTVGRQFPGVGIGKKLAASPNHPGLTFRYDVSRDQLAGVCIGWACILKFVDDPEIRSLAVQAITEIAHTLRDDDMWLRDHRGKRTEHGELRHDVQVLKMVKNGSYAAMGLAPFVMAQAHNSSATNYRRMRRLIKSGYRDALAEQLTWFGPFLSASNVNMASLALLSVALHADAKTARAAQRGLARLRERTRGWWHGAICATSLLGRAPVRAGATVDELRVCLHVLGEEEVPPAGATRTESSGITRINHRVPSTWVWKSSPRTLYRASAGNARHPTLTHTRADWLFAYWLARAAGYLTPSSGVRASLRPLPRPTQIPADISSPRPPILAPRPLRQGDGRGLAPYRPPNDAPLDPYLPPDAPR